MLNMVPLVMAAIAAVWVALGWNRPVEAIDFADADYLDIEETD
jgi:hypothetical protein